MTVRALSAADRELILDLLADDGGRAAIVMERSAAPEGVREPGR